MMRMLAVIATSVGLLMGAPSWAQKAPVKLTCSFDRQADSESVSRAGDFGFEITVDTVTGKAYMIGNAGVSELHMVTGSDGVTFLEVLATGAVQSTTIHQNSGTAVHSRHTLLSLTNELFPSQYYGTCE